MNMVDKLAWINMVVEVVILYNKYKYLKIVCLKLALSRHWYQSEPQEEWSGVTEDGWTQCWGQRYRKVNI